MRASIAVALLLLAGCMSADPDGPGPDASQIEPEARVVVAVIDTGINVYHERFAAPSLDDAALRGFTSDGEAPRRVALTTTGSYEQRVEADAGVWAGLEAGRLYYFEGTRVLGISFGSDVPVLDDGGASHGTATAGSVLAANPDAIVVLVESFGPEAEAWTAAQPWIDVVSMSYGPVGSVPFTGAVFGLETHVHTKAMWQRGAVPVGAADNTPSLAPNDETAGPPWVIGVAGDHPETGCREHVSGSFPDFTADFTQDLPEAYSVDGWRTTSGTSFSTPMTAGTFSRVLLEVRQEWGHAGGIVDGALAVGPEGPLTNADVREAFQRTATYFDASTACTPTSAPVNPAAPWVQMGWGHIEPSIVNATRDHLLGVQEAAEKPAAAVAYMDAWMAYRETLWSVQ